MPALVDLLWRHHADAPVPSRKGPRARLTTDDVVAAGVALANDGGLDRVRVRDLASALGVSAMSLYTYVNSREDLLVLMADDALAAAPTTPFGRAGWRTRVRRVADDHLSLHLQRPWLLDVDDPRLVLGPGAIARYDHQLAAFEGTGLDDVRRDAALTFVLDFVLGVARGHRRDRTAAGAPFWDDAAPRLGVYLADDPFPLASRVGSAAGEHMQAAASAPHAFAFGIERVLDGLAALVEG